jgi:large subunit ribosomal protein L29
MKRKEFLKNLRSKSLSELEKMAQEVRREIVKARMDKMMGKLNKPHILKDLRRKLARILTVINELKIQTKK